MDPDPWNWSVQDVQQFFRNHAATYMADMPHSRLPQLEPFLNALNDNDVDGAVLLTTIDPASLRDDCGVAKLGERGAVLHCITKLRRQSTTHLSRNDLFGLQTPPSLPLLAPPAVAAALETSTPSAEHADNPEPVGEQIRAGEVQVEDAHGRKRRKLDLSKPEHHQKVKRALVDLSASSAGREYFGDSAFPIDDIFYGRTGFGKEVEDLQPIGNVVVIADDRKVDLQEDNFQFTTQNKSIGQSRYVYSHIRHFLTIDKEINTRRRGRDAIGVLPYRDIFALETRSATVVQFPKAGQEPVAVRENAAFLSSGFELDEPSHQAAGEHDYLLEKYKPTDEVLPVFGEDEDDFDDHESQATTKAGDDEPQAEEDTDDEILDLSPERVDEVIEEFIAECITKWQDKLPGLDEKRAWSIWKKTKQSRTIREGLIQGAEANIRRFTKRLGTMKTEMLADTWQDVDKLRGACIILEPTIEDREEQKWMITVWRRRQEPPHVVRRGTHANRPTLQISEGGEKKKGIIVHPDDRFSVSPPPIAGDEASNDRDEEMLDEVVDEGGILPDEEVQYDADDEVYHTPGHSPSMSAVADPFVVQTPEEMDIDSRTVATQNGLKEESDVDFTDVGAEVEATDRTKDQSYEPNDDDDSESDLPSLSALLAKSNAGRKPKTPVKSSILPIDLTGMSDSPPLKLGRPLKSSGKAAREPTGDPRNATAAEVASWDWAMLRRNQDRFRILIKLLSEKTPKFRNLLDQCRRRLMPKGFEAQLEAALHSRRNATINSKLQNGTAEIMMSTAEMYIQWQFPNILEQGASTLNKESWSTILNPNQHALFTGMLGTILDKKDSKLFILHKSSPAKLGSSSAPIPVSSSDNSESPWRHVTPEKKRRRQVKRSAAALDSRNMALERQKRYEESQTTNSAQLVAMIASDPSHSNIDINPAKKAQDDSIYICDKIARQMKAHQIDGTRFLWREITAEGDEGGQGCILAHTMGLGKTMQTIALLVAVNEAAQSDKPSVYRQLPAHLRNKVRREERQVRVLILCPPGLVQNWNREIEKWALNRLGNVIILNSKNKPHHLNLLREWLRLGGVLLIGYEMFRSTLHQNSEKKNAKPSEELAELEKILLKSPEIAVADEAQNIKNEKSEIAIMASRISTESRIALTGTPMSNDVNEIYALVSWAAPNFLGTQQEFNGWFGEPIKKGLYAESDASERRKSFKQLKVLHAEIEPKINRANIEVLRGSLKPKIEYVITVSLGPKQEDIYRKYIKMLRSGDRAENASQMTLFAWFNDLTLLVNHPQCLREKLLAPPPRNTKKRTQEDTGLISIPHEQTPNTSGESGSTTPLQTGTIDETDHLAEDGEGPSLDAIQSRQILEEIEDNMDPALSAKVAIFLQLLDFSFARKDKVLVFSSRLKTLDYLGKLLERNGRRFGRIDGKHVPVKNRDTLLEQFRDDKRDDKFDIMLVSTRAGGVGLNMQCANRVFIFDFGFNPGHEEQAIGRAYRLGQTKPVFVYRLVTGGTFETNIYNLQLFKTSLSARVVDQKNPRRIAERKPSDYLYEPKKVPQKDLTGWADKDPYVLGRLLQLHGSAEEGKIDTMIRDISTMETLQEEAQDAPLNEEEQKEVNQMIEVNRKRPRGKKVAMGPPYPKPRPQVAPAGAIPSTAPQTNHPSWMVRLPMPPSATQGQVPPAVGGISQNMGNTVLHPLGGLPMPREQQSD